jgi:ribosomal protein S18 acetylase RimI-like enzyme
MKTHHPVPHRTATIARAKPADADRDSARRPSGGMHAPQHSLPHRLKAGIESLSGYAMGDVRVHYNSAQPARLQALAYTQGSDIHIGRGQERHLAHEAWHVVQQKQGRVKPTLQMKGVAINDDDALEREASAMGKRAAQLQQAAPARVSEATSLGNGSHQVTAARDGRPAGSVKLHERGGGVIEVTDLKADAAHRGSGIGRRLLDSALQAGSRLGGQTVKLNADDNGSGRLVNWYKQMGFRRTGENARGEPSLEASINRVLGAVAQRRIARSGADHAKVVQLAAPAPAPAAQDTKQAAPAGKKLSLGALSANNVATDQTTVRPRHNRDVSINNNEYVVHYHANNYDSDNRFLSSMTATFIEKDTAHLPEDEQTKYHVNCSINAQGGIAITYNIGPQGDQTKMEQSLIQRANKVLDYKEEAFIVPPGRKPLKLISSKNQSSTNAPTSSSTNTKTNK